MTFKRGNIEKQIQHIPKSVMWCKKCVNSNQRPRIIFDNEGICSGCRNTEYKNNDIDWKLREKELIELLDQHRRSDGQWDVIVPSSGGKDSGYVAHQLRYKYGMNPLTVTWSPLQYTDIGFQNFESCIDAGFTNLLCTPNGRFQRKLARLCFEELGDAFHVFVLGQISYPFQMALKMGIKLVFYGENGEAEYAGDPEYVDKPYKPSKEWVKQHFKGLTFRELLDFGLKNKDYLSEYDFTESDLIFYEPPSVEELNAAGILGKHFYSYYHKWSPQENYYYASENAGFHANPGRSEGTYSKYASLDDKTDGFHYYMAFIKFGIGRATADAANQIRNGTITRDEGVDLVHQYDDEFPTRYLKEFLEYMEMDMNSLNKTIDKFRRAIIWKKTSGQWKLRQQVAKLK